MTWKRFPVPEFDYRPLKGMTYTAPTPISADEAARIAAAAEAGDGAVTGGYAVEPDPKLLEALAFEGDHRIMILCALPGGDAHVLARSLAWFNQRALLLSDNSAAAEVLFDWRTPRTHNTRLGPEDGVPLDRKAVYLLNGRIVEGGMRGNRIMVDTDWDAGAGRAGFRILAGCDKGEDNFHDSYFEMSCAS